jgi:hypothetical protein
MVSPVDSFPQSRRFGKWVEGGQRVTPQSADIIHSWGNAGSGDTSSAAGTVEKMEEEMLGWSEITTTGELGELPRRIWENTRRVVSRRGCSSGRGRPERLPGRPSLRSEHRSWGVLRQTRVADF